MAAPTALARGRAYEHTKSLLRRSRQGSEARLAEAHSETFHRNRQHRSPCSANTEEIGSASPGEKVKLADCRAAYQELSGKASDLSRTLSLSAIAIIWVFKSDTSNGPSIPSELVVPGFFVVSSLALDLLQYVAGTAAWGGYGRIKELSGVSANEEFQAPRWLNWPATTFFYGKLTCVAVAYFLLLRFLLQRFVE